MAENKTPLQKLQDDARAEVLHLAAGGRWSSAEEALNAYLVYAFDQGIRAARELDAEIAWIDAAEASRREMARARLDDPDYRVRGTGRS